MQTQKIIKPDGKVVIVCDYREREVAKFLESTGASVNISSLAVGDFVCSERVVVERKEHGDFVSSIIDGRVFEQAKRMRDEFERPVIIVEGSSNRDINANALKSAIASLAISGASVLCTKNEKDTALTVFWLAKKEQQENKRELSIRVGKKPKDETRMQERILCGLPGVSTVTAKRLLGHFGSVERVFGSSEEELLKVKGVGQKLAKRIRNILEKKYKDGFSE